VNEHSRAIALTIAAGAAALTLAACGGAKDSGTKTDPGQSAGPGGSVSDGSLSTDGPVPKAVGGPLPKIAARQVKGLVGTWINNAKGSVGDYFEFKADGTGSWQGKGTSLWTGQVIPSGKDQYRLSWQGKDPTTSTFWSVKLTENGQKLVFQGTQQTYTRAKSA
jgi:hypothetical protein